LSRDKITRDEKSVYLSEYATLLEINFADEILFAENIALMLIKTFFRVCIRKVMA